jgi:hypothetical protein
VRAQPAQWPASAPVPAQIAAAQKVFISNAGGESFEMVIDQTVFKGGPDRPYNQFYASMKGWVAMHWCLPPTAPTRSLRSVGCSPTQD